jgi:hypothetical protein
MHLFFLLSQWSYHTAIGTLVRQSLWLFPVIETVHLFGIVCLVGSTSILDLRLMGVAFKEDPASKLAERYLPWALAGFAVQVVTGAVMFASEATMLYNNIAFDVKMLLILLAGLNALVFHFLAYRRVAIWDNDARGPISAQFAGLFSILLWFGIVAAGRWIAYVPGTL